MEARTWAWVLFIPLVIAASTLRLLATSQALLALSLFVFYSTSLFLIGFALSPDARPPKIPPRTHTARTAVIPLGLMALSAMGSVLSGGKTPSYYVAPDYLAAVVYLTSLWLLGAFAARRHDSHRIRPEASYDVLLREYHKTEKEPENPA